MSEVPPSLSNASKLLREMNEKHKEICVWFNSIGFKGPRNYDVNEKSINILWTTMKMNQEKDREVIAQIKEMETGVQEYEEKSRSLESKLKSIRLGSDHLSETVDITSHSLARIASHLEIETPSTTSFYEGLNNLVTKEMELELDIDEMEEEIEKIRKNVMELSLNTRQHQKVLSHVKEGISKEIEVLKSGENDVQFMKAKGIQYQKKIESLDKSLASIGITESLKHNRLMEMYERLKLTEAELEKLHSDLDVYRNLPAVRSKDVKFGEENLDLQAKLEDEINNCMKDKL